MVKFNTDDQKVIQCGTHLNKYSEAAAYYSELNQILELRNAEILKLVEIKHTLQNEIMQLKKELAEEKDKFKFTHWKEVFDASIKELTVERDELAAALKWYVDEDDVIEGMKGNEYWVEGKHRAEAILAKVGTGKGE